MEIMVEFMMFSDDFPVEEVIRKIDIPDYEVDKKGEIRKVGPDKSIAKLNEESVILYSTGYIETIDVDKPIQHMCSILIPHKKQIVECINQFELNAKFCIVINLTDNPIICLSREFIDLVSELHAEIELDSYVDLPYEITVSVD